MDSNQLKSAPFVHIMSTIHSDQFRSNSNQCGHHVSNMYILINSDQIPINVWTLCLQYILINVDIMSTVHSDQISINVHIISDLATQRHSKQFKSTQSHSKRLKATQGVSRRLKATQSDSKHLKETLFHNLVVKDFKRILNLVFLDFMKAI